MFLFNNLIVTGLILSLCPSFKIISFVSLILGIVLIIVFYSFSANLKSLYLDIKYQYSKKGDHLAVVNEDGLWIKEKKEKDDNIFIINASNFRNNILENIKNQNMHFQ